MSDMTIAAGRRSRWGLFIAPVLLLILAAAWSGFWFYAASQAEIAADAWRAQEAKAGRIYDCAKRSIAGFPFRFEVQCSGASVALVSQNASKTPFTAKLDNILVLAQVYDPKHVIAEFSAPATLVDGVTQNTFVVNWSKGRSSVVGLPAIPDRASIVFDDPSVNRVDGSVQVPLAPELAARIGSPTGLQVAGVSEGSPAAEAGLRRGDIVVELDKQRVVTTTAVQRLMVENAIDRRIEITVWRNGALVDVVVQPRELDVRS